MKSEWTSRPLGELVDFASGGTPSKHKGEYWIGDIPWISAKTLKSERITTSDLFISEDGLNSGSKLAPCGSILLLICGSGLFNGIPVGLVEKEVAFNQDIKCLNSCSEIENKFIFYWLLLQRNYLMAKVGVTGIGAGKFDLDFLQKLEVPIPSERERHQIIAIGDALSDKIELNQRLSDNLQQQAQAIYQSLFITYGGASTDCDLGKIPTCWPVKTLSEVTTSIRTKVRNNNYKVFSAISTGKLQLSEEYFTKQVFSKTISNYIVVEPFDFAYNPARVNIGSIGMNDFGYTGCVSPVYIVVRPEPEYHYFLDFFIKSKRFFEEVKTRASGSVRQSLSYADFGKIKVVYPPISVIQQFNREYDARLKAIKHFKDENKSLFSIRDALLPKLMSGEIDVSNVHFQVDKL